MPKQARKRKTKQKKKIRDSPFGIYWDKKNYIFLIAGFLLLIIGYYFMSINPWNSFSALVISPIILIIAYVLIFPASILYTQKTQSGKKSNDEKENRPA